MASSQGAEALAIYRKHDIRHLQSAPGDSASNDIAERTIRTFAELTTTCLLHANAPTALWAEAMTMVAYVWNHIPVMKTHSGELLSRVSLLEGHTRRFSLDVLRAFGTKCHYMLTLQKKGGLKLVLHWAQFCVSKMAWQPIECLTWKRERQGAFRLRKL